MKPGNLPLPRDYRECRRRLDIYHKMVKPLTDKLCSAQLWHARPTYLWSPDSFVKVSDNFPPDIELYMLQLEQQIECVRSYVFGAPASVEPPDPRIVRKYLQLKLSPAPVARREWYRASGQSICEECGYAYIDHPLDRDAAALGYDGQPINHILCNGDRVHL